MLRRIEQLIVNSYLKSENKFKIIDNFSYNILKGQLGNLPFNILNEKYNGHTDAIYESTGEQNCLDFLKSPDSDTLAIPLEQRVLYKTFSTY